jgi:hypothetical protein
VANLSPLGFVLHAPPTLAAALDAAHPLVLEEDARAQVAARLAFCILSTRWVLLQWHYKGCPGSFAILTSSEPEQVLRGLRQMEAAWAAWQVARLQKGALARKLVARSFMNQLVVQEVFVVVANTGFRWCLMLCLAD